MSNKEKTFIGIDAYSTYRVKFLGVKTMKRFISILLIAFSLMAVMPVITYADYGNSISLYETGNSSTLIYIKRPESRSASTSDRTYTISAVGGQGTKVKIYRYNPYTGACNIIKNEAVIGASGLYSTVVDLVSDSNVFMVTAENGANNQVVRIDINKIKKSTVDRLKNVTVTIRNFFD